MKQEATLIALTIVVIISILQFHETAEIAALKTEQKFEKIAHYSSRGFSENMV